LLWYEDAAVATPTKILFFWVYVAAQAPVCYCICRGFVLFAQRGLFSNNEPGILVVHHLLHHCSVAQVLRSTGRLTRRPKGSVLPVVSFCTAGRAYYWRDFCQKASRRICFLIRRGVGMGVFPITMFCFPYRRVGGESHAFTRHFRGFSRSFS